MDRDDNVAVTELVASAGITAATARALAEGLLEIGALAMPDTFFATDSRCDLARATLSASAPLEASAVAFIEGLDGTYAKSWAQVAAQLRDQNHPIEVDAAAVADLITAAAAVGLLT